MSAPPPQGSRPKPDVGGRDVKKVNDDAEKIDCPLKLVNWLSSRFGLLGLGEQVEKKSKDALKTIRGVSAKLSEKERETLKRFVLKLRSLDQDPTVGEYRLENRIVTATLVVLTTRCASSDFNRLAKVVKENKAENTIKVLGQLAAIHEGA